MVEKSINASSSTMSGYHSLLKEGADSPLAEKKSLSASLKKVQQYSLLSKSSFTTQLDSPQRLNGSSPSSGFISSDESAHSRSTSHAHQLVTPGRNMTSTPIRAEQCEENSCCCDDIDKSPRQSRSLGHKAIAVLQQWFDENVEYPYPDSATTEQLGEKSNLSVKQVKKWFANKRVRTQHGRSKYRLWNTKRTSPYSDMDMYLSQSPPLPICPPMVSSSMHHPWVLNPLSWSCWAPPAALALPTAVHRPVPTIRPKQGFRIDELISTE